MTLAALIFKLHMGTLIGLAVAILYTDKLGFSWLRGDVATLPRERLQFLHRLIWIGLGIMIATGAYMLWPAREYYLSLLSFRLKMLFVGILIINAYYIGRLLPLATQKPYQALTDREQRALKISGAVSTIAWLSAFAIAKLLDF